MRLNWMVTGIVAAVLVSIRTLPVMSQGSQPTDGEPLGCFGRDYPGVRRLHTPNTPKNADYYFDLAFDRNTYGSSFSCDLVMRPSEARRALEAFRSAVVYEDEVEAAKVIRFPFSATFLRSASFQDSEKVILRKPSEWVAFKRAHFDRALIALVACATVRNVDIVKGRSYGFMIGNGQVWFQGGQSGLVEVTAIQVYPTPVEWVGEQCIAY